MHPRERFLWTWLAAAILMIVVTMDQTFDLSQRTNTARAEDKPPMDQADVKDRGFRIPAVVVDQSSELAIAGRANRKDLKARRPAGLGDLDSPEAIQRATDAAMIDLADPGPQVGTTRGAISRQEDGLARLQYLGDAAIDSMVAGAESPNPQVAKWCCVALGYRGLKGLAALKQALLSHPNAGVRAAAASSLGQTFQPDAVPALITALDDSDASVRASVLNSIMYPRDPRAIEPLRKHTDDPGMGHVAVQAIKHIQEEQGYAWWPPETLGLWQLCQNAHTLAGERFGDAERTRLIEGLKSANGTTVYTCLLALGHLDVRESVPEIQKVADSQIKFHVLAQIATPEAFDDLIRRLESPPSQPREVVILGLADGADRWAAPLLISLLDDPSLKVEARGNPLPFSRASLESWPEWHRAHSALFQFFGRHGLVGRVMNLYSGAPNDVPAEIARLKVWWQKNGADFVAGKNVPNPELTSVMWFH